MPETEQKISEKILLIEDEAMLSSMYQAKFAKEGIEIEVAGDGEEGLKKAKEGAYKAVLVDIIMPKLDGFAVIKELRADPNYKDTPIILLTNLGQEEDVKKGKDLGASDYLVKANFTPSQVVKKIQEIINKK